MIKTSAYTPATTSSLAFVSDVPKSYTAQSAATKVINTDRMVIQLALLPHLEKLTIRTGRWLSINCIKAVLFICTRHSELNLSGVDTERIDPIVIDEDHLNMVTRH